MHILTYYHHTMRTRYIHILAQALAQQTGLAVHRIEQELNTLSDAQIDTLLDKQDEAIALILNQSIQWQAQ